jgi:hypothetical protein
MADVSLTTGYAFTDPLGASDPAGTRRRIRRVHALIYGAAGPSLLIALLADGGPLSQRPATGTAMVTASLLAALMLLWRRAPDALLLAAFPLAALTVTAVAVLDPPLALTPMYYVWPLMTAAYLLRRREILITYGGVCGSFGAGALWALGEGPLLIEGITVAIVGGVVVAFVEALKRGLGELVDRLHVLAREDPLTGALNRRAFVERVDHEIARAGRGRHSCAVAIVDVDHFKDINDRYGHAAGDAALRRLVATSRAACAAGTRSAGSAARSSACCWRARTASAPRPMRRSCARSSPPTPPAAAGPTRSAWESPCCRVRARARRASSTPPTARCTAPSARAATPSAPPDAAPRLDDGGDRRVRSRTGHKLDDRPTRCRACPPAHRRADWPG